MSDAKTAWLILCSILGTVIAAYGFYLGLINLEYAKGTFYVLLGLITISPWNNHNDR